MPLGTAEGYKCPNLDCLNSAVAGALPVGFFIMISIFLSLITKKKNVSLLKLFN